MADIRINSLPSTATSFNTDDYIAIDGASAGTRKMLAANPPFTDVTLGASGPSVKSTLSARAPRQGLVFDGTFGASFSGVPAFGTGDFTVSAWINPSALATAGIITGATNSFAFRLQSNGTLAVGKVNASDGTASTGTVSAGKFSHVSYVKSGSTGTYYINGLASGTSSETGLDYSVATTLVGAFAASTTQVFSGSISGALIYNRALSAAEVVALYEAGAPSGADYNSASNTSIITGDASTFDTDNGYWSKFGSATIDSGGNNVCVLPNLASYIYRANLTTVGKRYKITIASSDTVSIGDGSGGYYTPIVGGGSLEFVATGTAIALIGNNSSSATIDTVTLYPLGLLLAPDAAQAGGGYVWNDQSGNLAQIVLPSSGVQWNLPSVAGQRIRGTTSTNGNEQLLGASVLLPAECQITHVRARARSGTPTITIGTASGGAQIVASVALSTTWLNCTIALTGGIVSSADDIWVGSNSTDVVETDIAFQPLDF